MFLRKKKALSALIASTMVASIVPSVEIRPAAMTGLLLPSVTDRLFSWMWNHKVLTGAGAITVVGGTYYIVTKTGKKPINQGILAALGLGDYAFVIGSNKWQLIRNAVEIREGIDIERKADWRHLAYLAAELASEELMGKKKCYLYFMNCENQGNSDMNPNFTNTAEGLLRQLVSAYNRRNNNQNNLVMN